MSIALPTAMVVDHVAIIVMADATHDARARLRAAGLTESSTAVHNGQGTANIFYCFDNMFVELLWITDASEASQSAGARLFRVERAQRLARTCPFGIALRPTPADTMLPFATWPFSPPGSTGWHAVPVAVSSDDLTQPLIFRAQRDKPPADWTDGRAGERQRAGGFGRVSRIEVALADGIVPGDDLTALADAGVLALGTDGPRVELTVDAPDGTPVGVLDLAKLELTRC